MACIKLLGSLPVCAANINEAKHVGKENIFIWCSISYTGDGFPVFSWTKSNLEKHIAANTITSSGTSQGPETNTSSMIPHHLHANDSGATLQCRITFQNKDNSQENATNVYEYTCNYTLCKQSINYVK